MLFNLLLIQNTVTMGSTMWRKGIISTHSGHNEAVNMNEAGNDIRKITTRKASFMLLIFDVYEATSTITTMMDWVFLIYEHTLYIVQRTF